jgi:CubicO group peptidase (beta-lactamase class C family)
VVYWGSEAAQFGGLSEFYRFAASMVLAIDQSRTERSTSLVAAGHTLDGDRRERSRHSIANAVSAIGTIIRQAIGDGVFPGAAVWMTWCGETVISTGFGWTAPRLPGYRPVRVTSRTLYDVASLTKVVATLTAILQIAAQGKLSIHDKAERYLPDFGVDGPRRNVSIKHLLMHTSGMPAHVQLWKECRSKDDVVRRVYDQRLISEPGAHRIYSDLNYILLGEIVEKTTGLGLDEYCKRFIFGPLLMEDSTFNPSPDLLVRIAPTEIVEWRGGLIHGKVHDENAYVMGGVSGHAGLFSTVEELGTFCEMILGFGRHGTTRALSASDIISILDVPTGQGPTGLGWISHQRSFMGDLAKTRTFGHAGFTGTSIVINSRSNLAFVLLSNRVCPSRKGPSIQKIRQRIGAILATLVG